MTYHEVVPPHELSERLRRISHSRTRIDLAFEPHEASCGVWTGSSSPCEPLAQQLLGTLVGLSRVRGLFVADPEHTLGRPVAFLENPKADDWARLERELLGPLSAPIAVAGDGTWCLAWSDEDFFACGAAAHLTAPFRTSLAATYAELDVPEIRLLLARLRERPAPDARMIKHYTTTITWAYPVGHPVRDAWDHDPIVRQLTAGLASWD